MYYLVVFYTMFFMYSCSNDDTESITPTITVTDIERYSVVINGAITMNDNTEVDECGIYWSQTNEKPTDMDKRVIAEQTNGKFQIKLTNLQGGTTYYVRAYAKNRTVMDIGETIQFTTTKGVPDIKATLLSLGTDCRVKIDIGGGDVKEVGYCRILATDYNKNVIPNIKNCEDKIIIDHYSSSFTFSLSGTYPNNYYACIYMITSEGIGYSERIYYHIPLR